MCSRYADTINSFFAQPIHVQLVFADKSFGLKFQHGGQCQFNRTILSMGIQLGPPSNAFLLSIQPFPQFSLLQQPPGSTSEEARPMKSSMKSLQLSSKKAQAPSPTRHNISTCAPWHWKRSTLEPGRGREEAEADPASMAWFEASSGCQHGGFTPGFTMIYMFLKFTCS